MNGKITKQLTNAPGYDAEATVSPKKDKIVFTSTRNGDLDLYVMDIDGKNVKQITKELGYDGGAFFSPDGKKIVFRASRFTTEEQKKEYQDYLKQGLVAPTAMEILFAMLTDQTLSKLPILEKLTGLHSILLMERRSFSALTIREQEGLNSICL